MKFFASFVDQGTVKLRFGTTSKFYRSRQNGVVEVGVRAHGVTMPWRTIRACSCLDGAVAPHEPHAEGHSYGWQVGLYHEN